MILNINNQSNYLCNFEFKVAFTLAEVLITLLIVGIIASITIPAVIQNTNNAQHVTQLKKTYATLSQAFSLLKTENGGDISAVFSYPDSGSNSMNIFADKLNVIKKCGSGMGCWYTTPIKFLNGNIKYNNPDSTWNNQYGKAVLADGSILMMVRLGICNSNSGSGPLSNSTCGYFHLDINGVNGPNVHGRDVFTFWVSKSGIYPMGTNNDGRSCDINVGSYVTNWGCTAKVLSENAMNY